MVITGDTIRLKVEFKNWAGILASPNDVKLKIYLVKNIARDELIEEINVDPISVGKYQYDYTIPVGAGSIFYEFSGTLEDKQVLGRAELVRKWV
jgi:hypothetical protein